MKNRILLFVAIGLVVLSAVIYFYSGNESTFRARESDFSTPNRESISRIELMSMADGSTVVLISSTEGRWMLNENMYANESAIDELIAVLSRLQVRQPVSVLNRDSVEKMLTTKGIQVDVFLRSHRIKLFGMGLFPTQKRYQSILVGSNTPDGGSTYMRKKWASQAFKVFRPGFETGVSSVFDTRERVWRDPIVFDLHPQQIDFINVTDFLNSSESFVLKNQADGGFQFMRSEGGEPIANFNPDTARVVRFIGSFRDIYYESLLDDEGEQLRAEIMHENPFMEVTVVTTDGQKISAIAWARHVGHDSDIAALGVERDPNRFYVRVNDGDFAIAQYYVFNRILRPLSFFKNNTEVLPVD